MKAKIIRGTTLRGEPLNEGQVVDLDDGTFSLLRSNGQAVQFVPDEDVEENEEGAETGDPKKAPNRSRASSKKADPTTQPQS